MKTTPKNLERVKLWQHKNWGRVLEYKRRWRLKHPKQMQLARDNWTRRNLGRIRMVRNVHRKKLYKQNAQSRIETKIRRKITRWIFSGNGPGGMPCRIVHIVGASKDVVKDFLRKKFKKGMRFENHGYRGWHIDHKIPVSSFDLTNTDELLACFHYTNMQPLWYRDHIRKHGKVPKK